MRAMEFLGSPTAMGPLLLRNLVSLIFVLFDNSLLCVARDHKLVRFIRSLVISSFIFFLRILPSLSPSNSDHSDEKPSKNGVAPGAGDSALARALSQLLSIAGEIPVGSRKYDVVRALAEKVIDDNEKEGFPALREVNRTALSAAFAETLSQLERAVSAEVGDVACCGAEDRLGRVAVRVVRSVGELVARARSGGGSGRSGGSAEKLAAELLWLAQKLATCGFVEEAVWKWASAANMARLALSAEPRLQGSLVKLSAFLLKQGKDIGTEERKREKMMRTQSLQTWLPLLCRASNGSDMPVLSSGERAELQRALEETIEGFLEEDQQEKVLALWLHHFTHSSSSDWPDLRPSYARWCASARHKLLLIDHSSS